MDVSGPTQPAGYLACAELADIVYQSDDYPSYASIPAIKQIDFADVEDAAPKMQLAPLSRHDRIEAIMNCMGSGSLLNSDFGEQLLIDEGEDARTAIANRYAGKMMANLAEPTMRHSGGLELDPPLEKRFKTEDNAPISEPRYYRVPAY